MDDDRAFMAKPSGSQSGNGTNADGSHDFATTNNRCSREIWRSWDIKELATCNPFSDFLDDNFRSYFCISKDKAYNYLVYRRASESTRSHRNICSTKNLFKQPDNLLGKS